MSTQIELVNKIVELQKSNPDAEIKICVSNDLADDCGWTVHKISRVSLDNWIEVNEGIFTDEDTAKDEIMDMLYDEIPKVHSAKEFNSLVDDYYNKHAITAICVYTSV